jgi:hypothetical protein
MMRSRGERENNKVILPPSQYIVQASTALGRCDQIAHSRHQQGIQTIRHPLAVSELEAMISSGLDYGYVTLLLPPAQSLSYSVSVPFAVAASTAILRTFRAVSRTRPPPTVDLRTVSAQLRTSMGEDLHAPWMRIAALFSSVSMLNATINLPLRSAG